VKQLDGLVAKVQGRIERNRSYKNIAALLVRQNAHGSLLRRRAQLEGGASAADFPAALPLRLTPRSGHSAAQIFTIVYIVVLFLQRNPTESYQVASPRARRQPAQGKGGHEDPSPPPSPRIPRHPHRCGKRHVAQVEASVMDSIISKLPTTGRSGPAARAPCGQPPGRGGGAAARRAQA
jgi:hypothetical protein